MKKQRKTQSHLLQDVNKTILEFKIKNISLTAIQFEKLKKEIYWHKEGDEIEHYGATIKKLPEEWGE